MAHLNLQLSIGLRQVNFSLLLSNLNELPFSSGLSLFSSPIVPLKYLSFFSMFEVVFNSFIVFFF